TLVGSTVLRETAPSSRERRPARGAANPESWLRCTRPARRAVATSARRPRPLPRPRLRPRPTPHRPRRGPSRPGPSVAGCRPRQIPRGRAAVGARACGGRITPCTDSRTTHYSAPALACGALRVGEHAVRRHFQGCDFEGVKLEECCGRALLAQQVALPPSEMVKDPGSWPGEGHRFDGLPVPGGGDQGVVQLRRGRQTLKGAHETFQA